MKEKLISFFRHKRTTKCLKITSGSLLILLGLFLFFGNILQQPKPNTALESVERILINSILYFSLTAILLLVVIKFEDCISCFKNECSPFSWVYAVAFAFIYTIQYNPLSPFFTSVVEFTRNIGQGIMYGYDVSRVINNFLIWFALFALYLFFFLLFSNYARSEYNSIEKIKAWKYADNMIILSLINTVVCSFSFFYNASSLSPVFSYTTTLINLLLLSVIAYVVFQLDNQITFTNYQILLMIGFSLAYPIAAISGLPWANGVLLATIQSILFVATIVVLIFVKPIKLSENENNKLLFSVAIISSLLPLMLSFYIELVNVLNQYGVFIANPRKWYGISMIIPIILCIGMSFLMLKKEMSISNPKSFIYPFLILGISALSIQVPLTGIYSTDMFEAANYSVLISDFFFFGDIPIIEHYGGHMMSGVWEGILYGLVNGDFAGAAFSPYQSYITPINVLCFYWLAKTVLDEDAAFTITLFFPFLSSSWEYFGQGMLIAIALLAFVRKNTYFRAIILWFTCVWLALYRLDLGAAFIIAVLIALLYYIISKKNVKALKQLGITLLCYAIVFGTLWCVLCLTKGINPINRLLEFLYISASNQNWAYANTGNNSLLVYSWVYLILPFIIVAFIVYTILSKKFKNKLGLEKILFLIFMGVSYLSNFSRGLVRHSIAEMTVYICVFSGYVFIAIFVAYKKNIKLFLPVFAFLIMGGNLFLSQGIPSTTTIADTAASHMSGYSFVDSWNEESDKNMWINIAKEEKTVNRVQRDPNVVARLQSLKDALDVLLNEDETYVDFSNITVTYSYFERHNPVYVSQSPLQLSGEYSQECFIEQIQANIQKIPICLMPDNELNSISASLDGIMNNYRYYRVSEFIYKNYVPLSSIGNTAIWCLPERYEEMKLKISGKSIEVDFSNLDIAYDEHNCIIQNTVDGLKIIGIGEDPIFKNFSNYLDLTSYIGKEATIQITYSASSGCYFQMFYTTEHNEQFNQEKNIMVLLSANGTASFKIPVTQFTKIRLDIPDGAIAIIKKINVQELDSTLIDSGYDHPYFHSYNVNLLPQIWAEMDTKEASKGKILSQMAQENGIWKMNKIFDSDKSNGNYLLLRLNYKGNDKSGFTDNDDETTTTTVRIGKVVDGAFVDLYRYIITVKEGEHDYIIRLSSDYYWYFEEIDSVLIDATANLTEDELLLLEGD